MAISKLLLVPDSANYTVTDGTETLRTQLDGGAGRYRKDILNSSYGVTVSFTLTPAKFAYIRAFYKERALSGSLAFLIDLMLNDSTQLKEYTAYFVPGSFKTSQISGATFKVDAQLEVLPLESDDDILAINALLYEFYGEDMFNADVTIFEDIVEGLNHLVNEELPTV